MVSGFASQNPRKEILHGQTEAAAVSEIYLQKNGSPIPIEFVANIGRRITKTTRMIYFRYRSGFSLAVENFFPGIL